MRKNLMTGLSFVTALAVLSGCGSRNQTAETVEALPIVKTTTATLEEVENTLEFTSDIQAFKENNISPSIAVRIDQIFVDVGQNVRRGQLLVKMDPTQYNQTAVQLANIEADFNRIKAVYEAGGISKSEMEQMETQLAVQREQATNLQTNIELRSPIDGVVTARNYDPGDLYAGTPILQVMQINTVKVAVNISEQYFPMIKVGTPADITVDMYPGRVFSGKVSLVYPAIDPATRTFQLEVTIPNSGGELRPGMFSRTTFKFGSEPGVMVEDLAVQKQIGTNDKYIYVVRDGIVDRRVVTTGIQNGNKIHIVSGLSEGEEVVVAGFARIQNGSAVDIVND